MRSTFFILLSAKTYLNVVWHILGLICKSMKGIIAFDFNYSNELQVDNKVYKKGEFKLRIRERCA